MAFANSVHRIKLPKYIFSSIIISLGGFLFGLETGSIGSLTTMPQFTQSLGGLTSTVHGLVISAILLPAAFSSFFGGHLANSVGRPKAIALGAAIFGIGASIECASVRLGMLIAGRVVKGVGEGLFLSTSVVYITEISPPRRRGVLASIPQMLNTLGLCLGYFTCYGSVDLKGSVAWRLPFALQAFISYAFVALTMTLCPESPRWLSSCGRHTEAGAVWEELGVGAAEREKLSETEPGLPEPVHFSDILSVFKRDVWRQTALGVFMMGMQQASGIDGVLYYAPLLFASAGLSSSSASFLASGISALLIFAVTIPAFLLMERVDRRHSSIYGGLCIAACMFIIGILYATSSVHPSGGAGKYLVIICIYVFALSFAATWAVGFRVYVSEIQSKKTRAGGSSLALSMNWIVNWIVAFTTPVLLARSSFGVYFLFGGCTLATVAVLWAAMPETRGRTLEDIEEDFKSRSKQRVLWNEIELGVVIIHDDGDGDDEAGSGLRQQTTERRLGEDKGEMSIAVASGSSNVA